MFIIVSEIFQTIAVLLEGGIAADLILFEKYKVTDIVYESDTVTVYRTEHIYMSVMRIVKRILKNSVCKDTFYSEVNILKNIKNPNIPTLYDIEEDNQAYYIIEDYIEGVNLDDFIRKNGLMSEHQAVDIGIKLCHIIEFLHNQKPIPILFLDIQPKNIIICDEELYLVDFGNSFYLNETENRKLLMGTVGYAAPEQYKKECLDERTDIYGIGAVLYFLVTGKGCDGDIAQNILLPHNISEKFKIALLQCLAPYREDRLNSVVALENCLMNIFNEDNICTCNEKSRIISFTGADRRVGVTHVCLAFASYLAGQGYKVLYEEANNTNHLRLIAADNRLKYQNGFFYADTLMCKPLYGSLVSLETDCTYIIRDCGVFCEENLYETNLYKKDSDKENFYQTNLYKEDSDKEDFYEKKFCDSSDVVLVAGAKPWEIEQSVKMINKAIDMTVNEEKTTQLHILCNSGNNREALTLWKKTGCIGKRVPLLQHLLEYESYSDIEKQFFEGLKAVLKIDNEGGEVHRKGKSFFRKIAKQATDYINRYMGRS